MLDSSPVTAPRESANDEFSVVVEWPLPSGSPVKAGDLIVVLENSKTAFELTAERDGFLHYRLEPNDKVAVGDPVAYIADQADFDFPQATAPEPSGPAAAKGERRASAKAAKLMQEHGLSLDDFPGLEQVRESDVRARIAEPAAPTAASGLPFRPLPQTPAKVYEIAQLRAASAEAIPSSVVVPVASAPVAARLAQLAEAGNAVSILELVIHGAGTLLAEHPHFNAFYRDDQPCGYEQRNIGFAVNLGRGLKVPVVKAVDQKSQHDVAAAVKDLVLRYARDQLTAADQRDGTFTVTDLSLLQVSFFLPVLPRDQAAILGICAPAPGSPAFSLVLSFDHRLADGMAAARFLNDLCEALEDS